jgi:hypothetical protein
LALFTVQTNFFILWFSTSWEITATDSKFSRWKITRRLPPVHVIQLQQSRKQACHPMPALALPNPKYSVHQRHEMANKNMKNPEIPVFFFLELELMFVLSQI